MDAQFKELRELIVGMREHVDGRFNQIDSRFNQIDLRFNEVDSRFNGIDSRFAQGEERDRLLRSYVEERFNQIHDYIDERTHDMETRLLKGFQKWATSIELTIKPMPIRMGSIEERLSLLEERWKDIGNSGT